MRPTDCRDPHFWEIAQGDCEFASWLKKVDDLCLRILDQDLLSVPRYSYTESEVRDAFASGMRAEQFVAHIIDAMKVDSGIDLIDRFVARQIKWGCVPYEIDE